MIGVAILVFGATMVASMFLPSRTAASLELWQERSGLRILSGQRLAYPWNGLRCGGWSRAQLFVGVLAEEPASGRRYWVVLKVGHLIYGSVIRRIVECERHEIAGGEERHEFWNK